MASPDRVDPQQLDEPPHREELYGFRWGPVVVERSFEYRMGKAKAGHRRMTKVITVYPDKGKPVEVHVSSNGISVRVFRDGKELKSEPSSS